MEILISCLLGLWIIICGIISYRHYKNDEVRGIK